MRTLDSWIITQFEKLANAIYRLCGIKSTQLCRVSIFIGIIFDFHHRFEQYGKTYFWSEMIGLPISLIWIAKQWYCSSNLDKLQANATRTANVYKLEFRSLRIWCLVIAVLFSISDFKERNPAIELILMSEYFLCCELQPPAMSRLRKFLDSFTHSLQPAVTHCAIRRASDYLFRTLVRPAVCKCDLN